MKKILLLFAVIFCSAVFGQKRMYVYNFSSYDIYMSYFYTCPNFYNGNGGFPSPSIMTEQSLTFQAGQTYFYENNTNRFPYSSFTGMTWDPQPGGSGMSGSLVEFLYGPGQKFYFMKVVVDDVNIGDGGNLGQPYGDSESYISGNVVDYYFVENQISPTEVEYTIMIVNN